MHLNFPKVLVIESIQSIVKRKTLSLIHLLNTLLHYFTKTFIA
jgi:hypothetical protein